jgi:hypothetical protein
MLGTVAAATLVLGREALCSPSPTPAGGLPGPRGWHHCENPRCRAPIPNETRARHCDRRCAAEKHRLAKQARWFEDNTQSGEIPF